MKIQCDVCEAAEAEVVCCADEAALCGGCDLKVHAGNKLATKHQRLPLYPSAMPKCDVCQEALGWFFCLEDRAVLCRKCDIATHKGSCSQFSHQRLLLTGIRVGLGAKAKGNKQHVSEWSRILESVPLPSQQTRQ
ncbi:B-box zinc finger protein 22-like isoform X2 [Sesamum indicum]|uniref:B-box zinc finger protein 22-like isoform X2 n=1 Tax=Sesamum indicum TaxID=4182 RepID=A0A6I9TDF0_SESIN|nr:B-box zinc finger protein 22-like isoform X2 [Sesamum indicum]